MHVLLTDLLRCPRCGPEFGLILLADRMEERRVAEGRLGCANCRETYPVRGGMTDLRTGAASPEDGEEAPAEPPGDPQEAAVRLAALLGLAEGGGAVVVAGPGANLAPAVAALVPEVEVVALGSPPPESAAGPGVSRVAAGAGLPFRDRGVRGVALTGGAGGERLREALRVTLPGGRIVVDPAGPETAERLRAAGAELLLEQEGIVVARAARPASPSPGRGPG